MTSVWSLVSLLVFCICPCEASSPHPALALDEKYFRDAVARNPRDPAIRIEYGKWLMAQQRHLEAEVETRAAVNAKPTDPNFRADLATVLAATNPKRAEAEFQDGLARGESAELRAAYARFLLTVRGDPVLAAAEWQRAAQSAASPAARGEMLLAAARASEAAGKPTTLYAQAVEADRTATTLAAHAGFLRHVERDYRRAEQAYRDALALDARHSAALLGYATFLQTIRRQYESADALFHRAIEDPADAQSRHLYAKFLMATREYTRAAALAAEAVALDPDLRPAWAKVLGWDTPTSWRDCLRPDAAELVACSLLVLR